jgi:hypothetical protein
VGDDLSWQRRLHCSGKDVLVLPRATGVTSMRFQCDHVSNRHAKARRTNRYGPMLHPQTPHRLCNHFHRRKQCCSHCVCPCHTCPQCRSLHNCVRCCNLNLRTPLWLQVLSAREAAQHPHNIARGSFAPTPELPGHFEPVPAPRLGRTPGWLLYVTM